MPGVPNARVPARVGVDQHPQLAAEDRLRAGQANQAWVHIGHEARQQAVTDAAGDRPRQPAQAVRTQTDASIPEHGVQAAHLRRVVQVFVVGDPVAGADPQITPCSAIDREAHRGQLADQEVAAGRARQADGDVGLAAGDVEVVVAGDEIDAQFRMAGVKSGQPRRQPLADQRADGGDPHHAANRVGARLGQAGDAGHVLLDATGPLQHAGADRGGLPKAVVALEERRAQVLFERAQAAGDGGLIHPEPACGRSQCALPAQGDEKAQVVPIQAQPLLQKRSSIAHRFAFTQVHHG